MSLAKLLPHEGRPVPAGEAGPRSLAPDEVARGRLRILHVAAPAPAGGMERVLELLALGHASAGHEVHVAAVLDPCTGAYPWLQALARGGVVVHTLSLGRRAYLAERRSIATLCARVSPHVLHTHGYRPDVLDAPLARRSGIPTVTTVHGFTGGDRRNRLYELLQCRSFRTFDAVVAVSRPLAALLATRGVQAARIHTIQNAWAAGATGPAVSREELGVPPGAFHVGWVGRLSAEKGCDVLLRAVALLEDLPITVSVAGDGVERSRLEALARELGIARRVRWLGLYPQAERLFSTFDAFVLSSHTEGTPMVLFEAMHAGSPIVATRVGGVPDVVGEDAAFLVPPDDPAALAAAIRATRQDPVGAQLRAATALRHLHERFGQDAWLARYDALYRSVCGK